MTLHDADKDPEPEKVPKIGRGKRRMRLPARQLMMILMLLVCLIAVLALRKPCSEGVGNFFQNFDAPADAGPRKPAPGR
jgi:hypothetical protein